MPGGKVLVIDDSRVMLALIDHVLAEAGYRVFTTSNPYRALDAIVAHEPDAIVCDYTMPGMGAERLVPKLKADPRASQIPVIVYSSQSDPYLEETVLGFGAAALIEKSGDCKALIAKLRDLLEKDFEVEF